MKLNEELIKILTENPNLPIYKEYENDLMYDDCRIAKEINSVRVEEFLEYKDEVYTDKDDFKEDYYNYYTDEDVWDGLTEQEIENKLNEICDAQDWQKVILIC